MSKMTVYEGKAFFDDAFLGDPCWMRIPEDIYPTRELSEAECKDISRQVDAWIEGIVNIEAAWADMKAKKILCYGAHGSGSGWFIARLLSKEERREAQEGWEYASWRKRIRFDVEIINFHWKVTDYRIHTNSGPDPYLGSVLTERRAKQVVAELYSKNYEKVEFYGVRYGYKKYTRDAMSFFERATGLPECENPENKENKK